MHLLLIHQAFGHPHRKGGTRHFEFARFLLKSGHRMTVVTSDVDSSTDQRTTQRIRLSVSEEIEGVPVIRALTLATLNRGWIWRILSFLSFSVTSFLAALRVSDVDVVMGTSPQIFQAFSAWLVACLRRKPFLLEIRDLWPDFAVEMGVLKNPLLIRMARGLERFLYARADHIIVNSPAYRTILVGRGLPEGKVTLVSNGVDPSGFDPDNRAPEVREELNLAGQFVVTYAGALGMANDLGTLLNAAELLMPQKDVRFLVLGDGKERAALERAASQRGLTNVTFTGPRPKNRLPLYLAASDACLATLMNLRMFATTYPNKVFDYMAAGRPTLLAIDGVIREVIEQSGGGIYTGPGEARRLAEAVIELRDNPERRQEMGKAARAYVELHFHRDVQARQFLDVMIHMAGPTRAGDGPGVDREHA